MTFPNFFTTPLAYSRIKLGGVLMRAPIVEIDGIKIEADWSEQKATGHSGPTWVFKGMKAAGPHKVTFEAVNAVMFDDLRDLYERFGPQATNTGSGSTTASGGGAWAGAAPNATSAGSTANGGAGGVIPSTPGGSSTTDASGFPKSTGVNPGPRPPTLTVENAFFAYVGTTAVSLKSWDGPKPTPTNSVRVTIEFIPQKAPVKAGTGVAPPATGSAFAGAAQNRDGTPVQQADTAATHAGAAT